MYDKNSYLEESGDDFKGFIAANDWKNAQAVIDALWEGGLTKEAEELRRVLLKAQYESTNPAQEVFEGQTAKIVELMSKSV